MSRPSKTVVACACCGIIGPHVARGLRLVCYSRWKRRNALHRFPKVRKRQVPPANVKPETMAKARAYQKMVGAGGSAARDAACRVLSITPRTATRYERLVGMEYRAGA